MKSKSQFGRRGTLPPVKVDILVLLKDCSMHTHEVSLPEHSHKARDKWVLAWVEDNYPTWQSYSHIFIT